MAPSIKEQIKACVAKRERYWAKLQACYNLIAKPEQKREFLSRCKQLDDIQEKFEDVNETLTVLNSQLHDEDSGEAVDTQKVALSFDEVFFRIKAHEEKILENKSTTSESGTKLKLPTITIPVFTGEMTAFPAWRSLYDEIIHTSKQISDIQKFSYLRSYLQGSALSVIETISFCEKNYTLAYKTLVDRFSNNRLIATNLMNTLVSFQPLTKDNVTNLSAFLNEFCNTVESLRGLDLPDFREFVLVHHALRALDSKTRMEFENEHANADFPTFDTVVKFVKRKRSVLEVYNVESSSNSMPTTSSSKQKSTPRILVAINSASKSINERQSSSYSAKKCAACNIENHKLSSCPRFTSMTPQQRFIVVKHARLCFGCFSATHRVTECNSVFKCRLCTSKVHNTLLHPSVSKEDSTPETTQNNVVSGVMHSKVMTREIETQKQCEVLLGTATIQVRDCLGSWIRVRCVIDPGSQISAISEKLAQTLALSRKQSSLQITGIGGTQPAKARGEVMCEIRPYCEEGESLHVRSIVLPKITANLATTISSNILKRFQHLRLADKSYRDKRIQSTIDMLIGAECYADLIISNLPIIQGTPAAIPSKLGWLLLGRVIDNESDSTSVIEYQSLITSVQDPIAFQLQRFWEMEEIREIEKCENPEDRQCEEHFVHSHSREVSGKYVVRLPFRNELPELGTNRNQALSRLYSLNRKLDRDARSKQAYHDNLNDYISKGHMILSQESTTASYYLIHHAVYKEASSTTKLRVVFDPNIKGSNQKSLAESLLVGPKLQRDISDLLITFRLHAVALTADIEGMYRSINVAECDRKYQRILWNTDNQSIQEFELTTVTFGLPSSPYQAQRVLKQLVLDEEGKFPCAEPVINNEIYVDDIVTGGDCVQSVIKLREQVTSLLKLGGFTLRKFVSSHPEVLSDLPKEACELPHDLGADDSIKLLGIKWNPKNDVFFYSIIAAKSCEISKRKILSCVASIYDVNGHLSPVTIWIKIFIQKLWLDKSVSWDTPLSPKLLKQWQAFANELPQLSEIKLKRYILSDDTENVSLVGFADASSAAYAAVVYLRICNSRGQIKTHLIRAKTKVAPLKVLTINRLELCAALLLVKVMKSLDFLREKLSINTLIFFSDSRVVLSWLKTPPHQLKIYVANRVSKILEGSDPGQWRHISTQQNSADPASRGLRPSQLVSNSLWFEGPAFLKSSIKLWPEPLKSIEPCLSELKPKAILLTSEVCNPLLTMIEGYSSISKLKRVMAYVLRFVHNCQNPKSKRNQQLSCNELRDALNECIKITQAYYWSNEIKLIQNKQSYLTFFRNLSPIMHSTGILSVGGRLANAPISETAKHPILIPKKSHLAILLVRYYHELTLHAGPKVVQNLIQQYYWIIGARNLIRSLISKCIKCIKVKPVLCQPLMADLPKSRFAQGRAFINVGVDLAGPFNLKSGPRRNSPIVKAYFAIFICMSTKAIHLELLSSLSTPCFLGALDRFIGRRGLPTGIYSDNGTNFKGAARHLSETQEFLTSVNNQVCEHLQQREIAWHFNPPHAPNFGGLWEAGVKSVKNHLKHVIYDHAFNFEEFYTLLVQIEAILNSRPLCSLSVNPNDGVDVLTPGHFLTGAPLLMRPEQDLLDEPIPPLQRWSLINQAVQCFWKRWKFDYLNTVIQRSKWIRPDSHIKLNDVVIIQSESTPPRTWPLGKVTQLMPGSDGIVRVVNVRTSTGEKLRPVNKLAILPVFNRNN